MATANSPLISETMTEEDLHDEIDELAEQVEGTIAESKRVNRMYEGVFDSKYRRMEEAKAVDDDLGTIFS